MSKDFGAALKDNGAIYGTKHIHLKNRNVPVFIKAKRSLMVLLDVDVTDDEVVAHGCKMIIDAAEEKIRKELKEETS